MKIVLEKLVLRNWGSFFGKNEINFSVDPVKNITCLLGGYGSGKTMIVQGLKYCLFQNSNDNQTILSFLNKRAIDENEEDIEMEVSLKFHVVHKSNEVIIYEVTRLWIFEKGFLNTNRDFQNPEQFSSRKNIDGTWENITQIDFMNEINTLIPPVIRETIFLDDETLFLKLKNEHLRNVANYLIKYNEEIKNETEAREFIQMKLNELYSNTKITNSRNGFLKINEDWDFALIFEKNMNQTVNDLAFGHKMLITILYLLVPHLNINKKYPFIFDDIFSILSEKAKTQISRIILDILDKNQIIFLLNEMNYDILNPILRNRIGIDNKI